MLKEFFWEVWRGWWLKPDIEGTDFYTPPAHWTERMMVARCVCQEYEKHTPSILHTPGLIRTNPAWEYDKAYPIMPGQYAR